MKVILSLFLNNLHPILALLVALAEQMHPAPGSGVAKAKFVLGAVAGLAENHPELAGDVTAVVESAKPLMESAVKAMKDVKAVVAEITAGLQVG